MSKVLFIAPTSTKLNLSADLAAVGNGNEFEEVASGLLDREAVERLLRDSEAEILYLASDGEHGILQLSGELLDENDLAQMMSSMPKLRLVVINACMSLGVGSVIHNRYHVPVIAMEVPFGDKAAAQFARTFFSALRNKENYQEAFDSAKAVIARLYPDYANVPRILNGDMATTSGLKECMEYVSAEINRMGRQLDAINDDMQLMKGQMAGIQRNWQRIFVVALLLLAALLIAQVLTPYWSSLYAR